MFARFVVFLLGGCIAISHSAWAEVDHLTVADQFGMAYLPLMVMRDKNLIEKHAKASGLGDIKVNWAQFAGAGAMNDALLSGSIDIGVAGTPALVLLWNKTKGAAMEVKGIGAVVNTPMYLNSRDPRIKSLKDFTATDKIALPSVKISIQAITLQMAAAKVFGSDNYTKLDALTVSMRHPDAMAALVSGSGGITSHFTSPPFMFEELEKPGIHRVLSSKDVVGDVTFIVTYVTSRFREANPKTVAAFAAASEEAMKLIRENKRQAAEIYVRLTKGKESQVAALTKMLGNPDLNFTTIPTGTMKYAEFMHQVGTVNSKPTSWKDMFVPEAQQLPGS
jgi:NitT/TauT family transport system substrate-binding protein